MQLEAKCMIQANPSMSSRDASTYEASSTFSEKDPISMPFSNNFVDLLTGEVAPLVSEHVADLTAREAVSEAGKDISEGFQQYIHYLKLLTSPNTVCSTHQ